MNIKKHLSYRIGIGAEAASHALERLKAEPPVHADVDLYTVTRILEFAAEITDKHYKAAFEHAAKSKCDSCRDIDDGIYTIASIEEILLNLWKGDPVSPVEIRALIDHVEILQQQNTLPPRPNRNREAFDQIRSAAVTYLSIDPERGKAHPLDQLSHNYKVWSESKTNA